MNKEYIQLFKELVHSTALLAEQAMQVNFEAKDKKGIETATTMRDDYQNLYERFNMADFNADSLTKADYEKLTIAAILMEQRLEKQQAAVEKARQGYRIDTIPKLKRILDECQTENEIQNLSKKLFDFAQNS